MKILLSIHKRHTNKIISGEKTFELRRRFTKKDVKTLYIYETAPTKKVVAKAKIKEVHLLTIEKLWNLTRKSCGIKKTEFFNYFQDLELGYAIEMNGIQEFKLHKNLSDFKVNYPPQSFMFIR